MMSVTVDSRCVHCGASCSETTLAEGWCESCGKRIPNSVIPKAITPAARPVEDRTTGSQIGGVLLWLGVTAVVISLALVVFFNTVRIGGQHGQANPQQLTAEKLGTR